MLDGYLPALGVRPARSRHRGAIASINYVLRIKGFDLTSVGAAPQLRLIDIDAETVVRVLP